MYAGDSMPSSTGPETALAGHVKVAPAAEYEFVSVARASYAVAIVRIRS